MSHAGNAMPRRNSRSPVLHRALAPAPAVLWLSFLASAGPGAGSAGAGAASPTTAVDLLARDTLEELASRATPAVVLVDTRTPSGTRQGSGFLVTSDGRILTNHHVIRDARSLTVKLASGDIYDQVSLLAADERRDLAVLQISGFDLPVLPLGNSDSVRIGAPVVLIGSPLGLENTVSTGIVSGRRQEERGYQLLQISAPASVGSSGGPVLSNTGEVIGIAVSQMRSGQNLNFALPINYARGLLGQIDGEPLAVFRPDPSRPGAPALARRVGEVAVNTGFRFDLERFAGYNLEMEGTAGATQTGRTRVTYRRIETVGGDEPRIERYRESETTERSGAFGTPQTVRRERSRAIVAAGDLQPVSARGEIAWWTGTEWRRAEWDLRFEAQRVRGVITDTTGSSKELDRSLPPGILLREVRDLAFATLEGDSLVGRSVEFVTFDPATGEIVRDRYDVEEVATVRVAGESYRAFRVNIASGLANRTAHFRVQPPRILLREQSPDGVDTFEITRLDLFSPR